MPAQEIPLDRSSNLRDLGGWPTMDGRRVRTGLVFRAPALTDLSPADEATIGRLGLRTVCDFRGTREREHGPVRLDGAVNLSLPIEASVGGSLADIQRTGEAAGQAGPDAMLRLLHSAYLAYALSSFLQYRALFTQVLQPGALPLLLHCSAGKDRTGFGCALLLTALGVGWEHVVEDYLATNIFWRRESAGAFDMREDLKEVLLRAHEPLLGTAFDAIRREYGSVDAYLAQAIGLDPAARGRLAELLLQD